MKLLQQSDVEIAAQTRPLIEAMFAAIDQDDHEKLVSLFSKDFRNLFTTEMYQHQRSYCFPLMGNVTKVSFCELHRGQDDVYVLWHLATGKQARPLVLSSRFVQEGDRVVLAWARLLSELE